jgi:hypothetical protein
LRIAFRFLLLLPGVGILFLQIKIALQGITHSNASTTKLEQVAVLLVATVGRTVLNHLALCANLRNAHLKEASF